MYRKDPFSENSTWTLLPSGFSLTINVRYV
jgi:hypothetical protein